ncbi:hypothetical protein KGV52_00450 [Candidatus Gracilibacteria bacterium]|nr:hypothetical protein [Candidatus Gracilibacteria bacterium]
MTNLKKNIYLNRYLINQAQDARTTGNHNNRITILFSKIGIFVVCFKKNRKNKKLFILENEELFWDLTPNPSPQGEGNRDIMFRLLSFSGKGKDIDRGVKKGIIFYNLINKNYV